MWADNRPWYHTGHLEGFPAPDVLERNLRSLTVLDLLRTDHEYGRSFRRMWTEDDVTIAFMDDGCGQHAFAFFIAEGALIKGFEHESDLSPYRYEPEEVYPGILDGIPPCFSFIFGFEYEDWQPWHTTFCIWRLKQDLSWQHGKIPMPFKMGQVWDGSAQFLNSITYSATDYYKSKSEVSIECPPIPVLERVFAFEPLNAELLSHFPEAQVSSSLLARLAEIGYPVENELA